MKFLEFVDRIKNKNQKRFEVGGHRYNYVKDYIGANGILVFIGIGSDNLYHELKVRDIS